MEAPMNRFDAASVQIEARSRTHAPQPGSPAGVVHVVDADDGVHRFVARVAAAAGLDVRAYADVAAFLGARHPDAPGCLMIDARVPLVSGLKCRGPLRPSGLRYPIIGTAFSADVPWEGGAGQAGIVGFVEKPLDEAALAEAIDLAVRVDREQHLALAQRACLQARFDALSPREREVMALVTSGKLNKQVGGELSVSEITVKRHRARVMCKMGARSLADLVRMADAVGEPVAAYAF
jgi:FixJ family two-component response regulator